MSQHGATRWGAALLILGLLLAPASAEEDASPKVANLMGGPTDVGRAINDNNREAASVFVFPSVDRAVEPWVNWKARMLEKYGFGLGADYQAVYQHASKSLGDQDAASGFFRLFWNWTLLGRRTDYPGSFVFKLEERHRLGTDIAPEALGPTIGYRGVTAGNFGDDGVTLPEVFWKQQFLGDHPVELRLGRLASYTFFDIGLYSDSNVAFLNFANLVSLTVGRPPNGALGAAGFVGVTDRIYLIGTALDANAEAHRTGFDSIDEGEFFYGLELGWSDRGHEATFIDNIHATFWYADEREQTGVDQAWGAGLSGSWLFADDTWGPYLLLGWSEGGASILEKSVTAGVAMNLTERSDLFGIAGNAGQGFGSSTTQSAVEVFYRWQLGKHFAITPDLQYLINPLDNPDEDQLWVGGLRARLTL